MVLMVMLLSVALAGCAWWKKNDASLQGDGFLKMMELQKVRSALDAPQIDVNKKLGEPDAAEMERLGDQQIIQGNPNMAFVYYDKAVKMDPLRHGVYYKRGMLLISRGLLDAASAEFDQILKTAPDYALAHEGKGRIALIRGDLDESRKQFRRALELKEDLWQAYSFLGIIADRKKEYGEAQRHYQKAISYNPRSASLFNNLGMSYAMDGHDEKALRSYQLAAELDPENRKVYRNMAVVLGKLGRYEEALEAFQLSGDEASAYNNLGYIHMVQGDYLQAVTAFRKAIELKPVFYVKAKENLDQAETMLKKMEQGRMAP